MRLALALLLVAFAAAPADAQEVGRIENRQATPGGYFINAQPGESTTRVYVLGAVRTPGVYEIGAGFDLAGVFALAGGPEDYDRLPSRELRDPELVIRLLREGSREPAYEARLADFLADPASHPTLRDGDTITASREGVLRVYVWGSVRTPGLYEVGPGYDAPAMLSLAGGPLVTTLRNRDRRTTTVRVLRPGTDVPLFDGPIDAFTLDAGAIALRDGDVIEVEVRERTPFSLRDTITVIGGVAGVVTAIVLTVDRLTN